MRKKNSILVICAHPDDEILGCGGTLIKLKKHYNVFGVFLTNGESSRNNSNEKKIKLRKNNCEKLFKFLKFNKPIFFDFPDNKIDSVPLLEIIKPLEEIIKTIDPSIIFTHSSKCLNIDHRKVYEAVITATRPTTKRNLKKILSFEIPSSTEWSYKRKDIFQPNYFVNISKQISMKIKSLKFYKNEMKKYPHSRSIKGIRILSEYRGMQIGVKNAEAFYLVRYLG